MGSLLAQFGGVLESLAPTIATVLGGPLAGMGVTALEGALGLAPGAGAAAVSTALASATPDQLLAIKQADAAFKEAMAKNEIDIVSLSNQDRASARAREVSLKDHYPAILGSIVTLGFFGLLGLLCFRDLPTSSVQVINIMVGVLGTAWISVVAYYFGSSAGSKDKDTTIAAIATTPTVGGISS